MRLSRSAQKSETSPQVCAEPASKRLVIGDLITGSWEALVNAREASTLFRALPHEHREHFYRCHDRIVAGLSGAARFDPATAHLSALQAWTWACANHDSDAHDLQTALHALLVLAAEMGLRASSTRSCGQRTAPFPATPTH